MTDPVGRYPFSADTFQCDFRGHLLWGRLGNMMLNAADFHSSDRGFGIAYLNEAHKTWVLSRLAIEMNAMPERGQQFFIETWVENALRFFTHRNFAVKGADGTVLGYGRSIWAMISTDTRQPQDILAEKDGAIRSWIDAERPCPIAREARVKMPADAPLALRIPTHYSDIDINGHVNSIKYIEHVLDLWPLEWHRQHALRRLEVAYVAEAHAGEQLSFYTHQEREGEWIVRVCKNDSDDVCRFRVIFGAEP